LQEQKQSPQSNSVFFKVNFEILCLEGIATHEKRIKDLSIDVLLLAELKLARRKMEVRTTSSVREYLFCPSVARGHYYWSREVIAPLE